jgi:hypothetical protein
MLCVALAVYLDRIKKKNAKEVAQVTKLSGALTQFALFGGGLVSEFYLASGLVSGSSATKPLGEAIFASRLLHLIPTGLVILAISSSSSSPSSSTTDTTTTATTSFKRFLQAVHFFENALPYSLLLLLCLVEAPLLQYLPWRASPFANVAGFPNLFLLRLALVIKTAQNTIVLVCQFIVVGNTSSTTLLTSVARTFLYINVAITLTIAVLGLLEGYLKRSLLAGTQLSIEFNNGHGNENTKDQGGRDDGLASSFSFAGGGGDTSAGAGAGRAAGACITATDRLAIAKQSSTHSSGAKCICGGVLVKRKMKNRLPLGSANGP